MRYSFVTQPHIAYIVTGQIFPGTQVKEDPIIFLRARDLPFLENGTTRTLVQYGGERIRVPEEPVLPLVLIEPGNPQYPRLHWSIRVPHFAVTRFGELTSDDARSAGYRTLDELVAATKRACECSNGRSMILDEDWVSIYELRLA